MKLCECGCGATAPLAKRTRRHLSHVKGEPVRFVPGHGTRVNPPHKLAVEHEERDCGYATPCWVCLYKPGGHGYCWIGDGRGRDYAHRVYYRKHVGEIPEGMMLDHLCRNRRCVNPDHLEVVTNAENVRRGRSTKLSAEIVREIRASQDRVCDIARRYGISSGYVSNLKARRAWVDV